MKTKHNSAFTALRRDRQNLLVHPPQWLCYGGWAATLVGALAVTTPTLSAQEPAEAVKGAAEVAPADNAAELAKKLQNPIASLISVPIQNNFDFGAGPNGDGFQYLVRIQPVIPVSLSKDWNLISRTILPVIYQEKIIPETHNGMVDYNASQSGLGDTIQNLFFSPAKPMFGGWIWGAGPVFQLPTATDRLLGQGQWCAGPTAVVLKQEHGFTLGMLVNQFWSFAGWGDKSVNYTFLQPFLSYTLKTHTTFAVNTESVYNWEDPQWTVPVNLSVKQLVKIGKQPVQFEFGGRYYAEKPDNGPEWGLRFTVTFLFPK